MTDHELETYLRENGYPEHLVGGGRAGLAARWNDFVAAVERGYRFGLEDYRNDLDVRGVIALAGLDADVAEADARFARMLTARDKRVWESAGGNPFWDFGYPENAAGELMEDLIAEGLAEPAEGRV